MAEGSGLLKKGENGKGIASRWYPKTIAKRIIDISERATKITFIQGDGLEIINEYIDDETATFFIDPPYTAGGKNAGKRLYKYSEINHQTLFKMCKSISGDFLMTYEDSPEVVSLAEKQGFDFLKIPMTNTHNSILYELVIGKELNF